jgi:hypothetical protein
MLLRASPFETVGDKKHLTLDEAGGLPYDYATTPHPNHAFDGTEPIAVPPEIMHGIRRSS